jgi:hypothetical protein
MNKTPIKSEGLAEVFETVWPDKSFAQFGGHVLERLFDTHREIAAIGDRRFSVKVIIEVGPIPEEGEDVSQA